MGEKIGIRTAMNKLNNATGNLYALTKYEEEVLDYVKGEARLTGLYDELDPEKAKSEITSKVHNAILESLENFKERFKREVDKWEHLRIKEK